LQLLPLLAGENIFQSFITPTIANCIDLVVQCSLDSTGVRRVVEVAFVTGRSEEGVIEIERLFKWNGNKYENINMGSIGLLQSLMKQSGSVVDGIKSTAGAAALAGVSMLPEKVKQMAAASAKMRINPFKQTYFEEMEYRRFQYEYTLVY
jgi:hypothetical protein